MTPVSKDQEKQKKQAKTQFLRDHLGDNSLGVYNDIVDAMSDNASSLVDDSFWYLSIVGILPAFQGQGLGVDLVTHVLKEADRKNIPTYLETFTPRNETFYKRLGYEIADSFLESTTGARYSLMIRQPDNQSDD